LIRILPKDDHFLTWWNSIVEVTRFMGGLTEFLTGDVLFNLLGDDVRATIGAKLEGFGTLDLGAVEKVLMDIFLRSGEERYDRLFSWKYDETKSFLVNIGKFNSLATTASCEVSLKRHAWLKAIPDDLAKELYKYEDDWKRKDWKALETVCEKSWKRVSINREYKEKRNKTSTTTTVASTTETTTSTEKANTTTNADNIVNVIHTGCYNCGQEGHNARDCTKPRKERVERRPTRPYQRYDSNYRDVGGRGRQGPPQGRHRYGRDNSRSASRGRNIVNAGEKGRGREWDRDYDRRRSANQTRTSPKRCFRCHKVGHVRADCWLERNKRGRSPSPSPRK